MQADPTPQQRLKDAIAALSGQQMEDCDFRVQVGRRFVQGMVGREQRDDLSHAQVNLILAAIQQQPTSTAELENSRRVPQFAIEVNGDLWFRQERDLTVSYSAVSTEAAKHYFCELQSGTQESARVAERLATYELESPEPVVIQSGGKSRITFAEVVEAMTDPLGQNAVGRTALGGLVFDRTGDETTVSNSNGLPVATVVNGEATIFSQEDVAAFEQMAFVQAFMSQAANLPATQIDGVPLLQFEPEIEEVVDSPLEPEVRLPADAPTAVDEQLEDIIYPDFVVESASIPPVDAAIRPVDQMPQGNGKSFWRSLLQDLGAQASRAVATVQQGLASEQVQTAKQVVTDQVKHLKQQGIEWVAGGGVERLQQKGGDLVREGATKAAVSLGRGLEKTGQWLASRPEAIREHRAAKSAYDLFMNGYARTQEKSYEVVGLNISFQGQNTFTVSNRVGVELLKFQAERGIAGSEPRIKVLSQSGLSHDHSLSLNEAQQSKDIVRGSNEAEQRHGQRSSQFASVARMMLAIHETNDHSGKHFRSVATEAGLKVLALDGRGEIYREENGQVASRLEERDFRRFETIIEAAQSAVSQRSHSESQL